MEIVNPDLYICTLAAKGHLRMELNVERGKGYVPAERNKREGQPIGVIPIDAIFSPVEKANFTVEKTRVGQSTDYDRLLIEVWTDGTMSPEEAVSHAAELFTQHLNLFVRFRDSIEKHEAEMRGEKGSQNRLMDTPIEELDLSVRAFNCLKANEIQTVGQLLQKREEELLKGSQNRLRDTPIEELDLCVRAFNCLKANEIQTVGQLLQKREEELLALRNFGRKSLDEIKEKLVEKGFIKPEEMGTVLRG